MVYVSQEAQATEILRDIAKQVGFSDEKMNENLEHNLYLFLQEKKYLIFLDDIWNIKTWDQLRDTLLVNSENGSRIIVTSRHTNVGNYIGATARYLGADQFLVPLDVLSKDYALYLFKDMISGPNYENEVRKPLREIGEKIVDKCGGLPLAIEVVVGMLRVRGMSIPAWNEVLRTMTQIPENNCLKLLSLSYNDLPRNLKPLFLYLGIFPENREILVPQLIPLWVAEKFIRANGNQDDDVENQINELISRNLLQVSCRKSDGRVRSFRMHSLVHDLCMQLGEENNYFCTRNNLTKARDVTIVRRVTTNTSFLHENAFQDVKIPKLRALFCFYNDVDLFKFLKDNAPDLHFLRLVIIEFYDGKVVKVPEEIANLSGLIYLKMIGNVSEIPESIRRLRRLQTLEIRSTDIPEGVLKMKHVKHLFLSSLIVVKKPHGLPCFKSSTDEDEEVEVDLPNIQSLDVDFGPKLSLTPSSVKKLTSLKSLGIQVSKREMMDHVFPAEPVLTNIEAIKLKIHVSFFDDIPKLDLYEYHSLKKLNLYFNTAHDITGKVVFPPQVMKISLRRVTNIDDHMDSLKKLSNLESLKLKKCKGHKLDFSGEGNFPKLQLLMLKYTVFTKLVVDDYGIPRIYKFIYEASPLLENVEIPERLRKVMEKEIHEEV
ncbi:Apoptotic ATPase [Handroanthus impetiginosus]|uniref:Apoptotic ATPase n=1 Tax=Handroanthus impetiginosus TaxID=429701 RepID=A0A2G9H1T7_9LAMI|nr:Apoptotic ATPase [Handroanthus impetiginosus]